MNHRVLGASPLLIFAFLIFTACTVGIGDADPPPSEVELAVLVLPPDKGYVEIDGADIESGVTIQVINGELVTVVAKSTDPNWQFVRWERDLAGTNPGEAVVMDRSKIIRAVFEQTIVAALPVPTPSPVPTPTPVPTAKAIPTPTTSSSPTATVRSDASGPTATARPTSTARVASTETPFPATRPTATAQMAVTPTPFPASAVMAPIALAALGGAAAEA